MLPLTSATKINNSIYPFPIYTAFSFIEKFALFGLQQSQIQRSILYKHFSSPTKTILHVLFPAHLMFYSAIWIFSILHGLLLSLQGLFCSGVYGLRRAHQKKESFLLTKNRSKAQCCNPNLLDEYRNSSYHIHSQCQP